MKTIIRKTLLFTAVVVFTTTFAVGQRVIKGTVYLDGKPAAGITVEAHKGGDMLTSFDGIYEVEADAKSKWIKFTFIDDQKKLDIEGNSSNEIDFAFDGNMPSGGEDEGNGINLQSAEELTKAQDKEFMNEYSLYREFYLQEDYKSALPHWNKVYNKYPKSTPNIYIHGAKMYQKFADDAKTPEEIDEQLQKLMSVYDKRVKHFGQKGFVFGRKGTYWLKYKIDPERRNLEGEELKTALKKGYEWIIQSVNDQGNETEAPVLVLLMRTSRNLFQLGEITKEAVVSNYDICNSIINAVVDKNEDKERVESMKLVQPYIETVFGLSGAADCEALVNIYTPQFQEKSDDIEFIKNMLRRLGRAKCDESELFAQATEKLYELDPSAEAAFNMARRFVQRNEDENAKKYYKQAMEQETDDELLATYYYEYGLFIYAKDKAYSEARDYARKALAINPNYCEASMLIGDIYVAASSSFSGSNLEKSAVFWLAVDYFNKARRGEDCAINAAQKASTYKKYFPNKEDAFMDGLQEGQNYKVEGWINETTKVRF